MKLKRNLYVSLVAILGGLLLISGCPNASDDDNDDGTSPTILLVSPANNATNAPINGNLTAAFSEAMDSATIVAANFTLLNGATPVLGTVTYDIPNKIAVFAPSVTLANSTLYTATVTTGVKNVAGVALAANRVWTFTTAAAGLGPSPVSLGTAGNFAILACTGIATVPSSVITGDIGLSPYAESFMTGFSQTKATGYSTSDQVTGFMYAADMTPPTPTTMTTAISDMQTAYTDAAGRVTPDFVDLHTGAIGGQTLVPGLYIWNSSVGVSSDVTISGAANDVWIFQINGDLTVANDFSVLLSGGALSQNIFWQVTGTATIGTGAHFEGILLCQTAIALNTAASMNGRLLAQTSVALDQATVTEPAQ